MEGFGARLTYVRKQKKITQQQAADAVGVCRTTYTKYETDRTEPSLSALAKLIALYEADANFLLLGGWQKF